MVLAEASEIRVKQKSSGKMHSAIVRLVFMENTDV
jgi:hypothetical protein